jgi:hypothetical protein
VDTVSWIAIKDLLRGFAQAVGTKCSDSPELEIASTATDSEVQKVERELGRKLPDELRTLFLGYSSHVWFNWYFSSEVVERMPERITDIRGGCVNISLGLQCAAQSNWTGFTERFPRRAPNGSIIYQSDDLWPFMESASGDVLGLVVRGPNVGSVVLQGLESTELDCARLGDSFAGFLLSWAEIGCPGPDVYSIGPFYDKGADLLDVTSTTALEWKAFCGLGVSRL